MHHNITCMHHPLLMTVDEEAVVARAAAHRRPTAALEAITLLDECCGTGGCGFQPFSGCVFCFSGVDREARRVRRWRRYSTIAINVFVYRHSCIIIRSSWWCSLAECRERKWLES